MSDALEQALRSALRERASGMPGAENALGRLGRLDYRHARRRRAAPRRSSLLSLTAGGLAAVAVAATLILSSGGSELVPLAYAGYSAIPQRPAPIDVETTRSDCERQAGPLAHSVLTAAAGRLILAERRGNYVAAVFAHGRASAVCLSDRGRFAGAEGSSGLLQHRPGPDQLARPTGGGGYAPGFPGSSGAETHAIGRAGRAVRAVTLIMPGHRTVQATLEHGWYFAWWPGRDWPTEIRFVTRTGTHGLRTA